MKLLSYAQAAETLGVSRSTLYRMIAEGALHPINIRPDAERPTMRLQLGEVMLIANGEPAGEIEDRPTALYRHYDAEGRLLYVGITYDPVARWSGHRWQTWFREVVSTRIEWHPSRLAAQVAEVQAINDERPKHNFADAHYLDAEQKRALRRPEGWLSFHEGAERLGMTGREAIEMDPDLLPPISQWGPQRGFYEADIEAWMAERKTA